MIKHKRIQYFVIVVLLLLCTGFFFLFDGIEPYFFTSGGKFHIIDVHIEKCGLKGFFDAGYIREVRQAYDPEKYMKTFFLLDAMFPFLYSSLFLALSFGYSNKPWSKWVILVVLTGALFDYGENISFAYFLHHSNEAVAALTAFFTSIKSLLFPSILY